jgi:type II secretory pathway pseudopilin PulG
VEPESRLPSILDRLQGVRHSGSGWVALCPTHDDSSPSLSISERNGKILFHCHAGCAVEKIVAAVGLKISELFAERNSTCHIAATYDYTDERGELLFQVVRLMPKTFKQRRPDGRGGWTWNLAGTRRVLYRLPEVLRAESLLICEGEKDCDAARSFSLVATCIAGGAGNWKPEFADFLRGKQVAIIADADEPGRKHAEAVAASLFGKVQSLKVLELPSAKDLSEWQERGGTHDALGELIRNASEWKPTVQSERSGRRVNSPWSAEGMETFLGSEDEDTEALFERILFRETVTEIFSPRGIGKSLFALFLAVWLALRGFRVLLLDRDNPRRVVRDRLRAWGAGAALSTLKVITREKCPPLTNSAAWGEFPYLEYDVIILDSLDSMAEGVSEQDSSKPSRAIAAVLDVARREGGPAVLILGNCVRTGKHSRGSGVIEDRSDIVFEVRDCTNFHPSGKRPWIEELPASDAASWASKSSRRKGQVKFRLAFIPTKFRIGEEPDPFAIEIDTTMHPWTLQDVSNEVDREGKAARERQAEERAAAIEAATELLKAEILRRKAAGEPVLLKKQAETLLTSRGIKQKIARNAINSPSFESVEGTGKGHPRGVRLAGTKDSVNRNTMPTEPPNYAGSSDGDFGQPHPERATEISTQEAQYPGGPQRGAISVASSIFTPSAGPKPDGDEEVVV